jgi:hypothetical protein
VGGTARDTKIPRDEIPDDRADQSRGDHFQRQNVGLNNVIPNCFCNYHSKQKWTEKFSDRGNP